MEKDDRLERVTALMGSPSVERLRNARGVVVGYGAVGSFCTEALVRSGVGHIRIIDADVYSLPDCNRQLGAESGTIGQPKVEVGARHLRAVAPDAEIEAVRSFVGDGSLDIVFGSFPGGMPDFIVDAIDSIDSKVALLRACVERGVRVYSSMGAARKDDPALVRVADIAETNVCPLAREVRRRLRKCGIERGIRCVYSIQEAAKLPAHEGSGRPALGSIVTVTGVFGLTLASEAIRDILGARHE